MNEKLDLFVVTGEHSGDQLGARLVRSLRDITGGALHARGVGGPAMAAEGVESLFPIDDIAVMGFGPVVRRLPTILRRLRQTVDAVLADPPDMLVIIDSPDFTHRVARAVRRKLPDLPVVDYVSPSVWAWRPGRAKAMRGYVDHVLALLPFEPGTHERLGGPACTYVGHPLIERLEALRPVSPRVAGEGPILVLPGSRGSVIERHMPLFGAALAQAGLDQSADIVLPTVPRLAERIRALSGDWPVTPRIIVGEDEKFAEFRRARAALAASGTVTLELGLSGVPMIGVYKLESLALVLRPFVHVDAPYFLLPNLILDRPAIPELIDADATPEGVGQAFRQVLDDTPARRRQIEDLRGLDAAMGVGGEPPSRRAAEVVLQVLETKTGRRAPRP